MEPFSTSNQLPPPLIPRSHKYSFSARLARTVFKALWQVKQPTQPRHVSLNSSSIRQRLDDLKLQLRSSSSSDRRVGSMRGLEAAEAVGLQDGLSSAASALHAANLHAVKQKQELLDQQHLENSLPQLQLQLQLHAADATAPVLSLLQESDIMAAAQQGRYACPYLAFPPPILKRISTIST